MLVSIITVNYNNLEGLKKTIESVRSQTYKTFEHIVVDGGSNDGSAEYIQANYEFFDYWLSEPDSGVYQAMNKGIKKAKGEYLLFLNSGDHFYKAEVLEENYQYITNYDIIYFDLQVIDTKKTFIKKYPNILSFSYFVKDTLPHPATFIKKELFNLVGLYKEDFKIVSDWKFFMDSICKFNVTYKYVTKIASVFYLDGISSKPENRSIIFKEKQNVLKSEYPLFINDIEDVIKLKTIISNLKMSRFIKLLIKFKFLNKF